MRWQTKFDTSANWRYDLKTMSELVTRDRPVLPTADQDTHQEDADQRIEELVFALERSSKSSGAIPGTIKWNGQHQS